MWENRVSILFLNSKLPPSLPPCCQDKTVASLLLVLSTTLFQSWIHLCCPLQAAVPALVMFATGKDEFRKPGPGMWRRLCDDELLNGGMYPGEQIISLGDHSVNDSLILNLTLHTFSSSQIAPRVFLSVTLLAGCRVCLGSGLRVHP